MSSESFEFWRSRRERERKTAQIVEITGISNDEASQLLAATNWVVEEAVQLFFNVGRDGLRQHLTEIHHRPAQHDYHGEPDVLDADPGVGPLSSGKQGSSRNEDHDEVPDTAEEEARPGRAGPPGLPPRRQIRPPRDLNLGGWQPGERRPPRDPNRPPRDLNLAPPYRLLFIGNFHAAKVRAESNDKWLIANVQRDDEVSQQINKHVWRNREIQDIVQKHFIFFQVYDHLEEGIKLSNWYKIGGTPAILIIDPKTGLKLHQEVGPVDAQRVLEILRPFTEKGPLEDSKPTESVVPEEVEKIEYPVLPREPAGGTPGIVNIAIRLPYGNRIERKFLATDPIQVLWSFAANEFPEGQRFVLISAIRGIKLKYEEQKTIEEAGVGDTVLTLVFLK